MKIADRQRGHLTPTKRAQELIDDLFDLYLTPSCDWPKDEIKIQTARLYRNLKVTALVLAWYRLFLLYICFYWAP